MSKKFYALLLFFALTNICLGQMHNGNFGNEWINYGQTYYKMKIVEDGLYRIPASALNNAGISTSGLQAGNYQIFSMGSEIPCYVQMNGNTVDFIEFYGKKHRGEMDVNLYYNANHHFNTEYSAITDTAAYFLTVNNSGTSRQFSNSSSNLSNLPPKDNFYMQRAVLPITSGWQRGKEYQISTELLTKSSFDFGEGWGSNKQSNQTHNIALSNIFYSGPQSTGKVRLYSANNVIHNLEIRVSNSLVFSTSFAGDSVGTHNFAIPNNLLLSNTPVNIQGLSNSSDLHSASVIDIIYPRAFDFGGSASFYFKIGPSSSRKYLEISNFNGSGASGQTIFLYDLTNNLRIRCFWDGSRVLTDLPPSTTERELVLINTSASNGIKTVGALNAVNFTDYSNYNGNYIIVYHPKLSINSLGNNPIVEYAAYRASTGFNPVVIDIMQVFDQFGYGIDMHPVSIRNLAAYLKQEWDNPEYIFLIGKGRIYNSVRNFNTFDHLIPSFGYPPSDHLLLSQLGSDAPIIPVGRLAATSGDQVSLYLQKIRDVENQQSQAQTLEDRGWMKNVIHLGGGSNSAQQTLIRQNLDAMKDIIEGPRYGGNVTSFFKTSSNPIQAAQSAYLDSMINSGVSLVTFFGHSSANSFDFNLDRPENYNNYQKYPMFISLGCYGGTIFEDGTRISEEFIFEPDAGASVFFASVGAAALNSLNAFANIFYSKISGADFGKGAAAAAKSTIEQLENSGGYGTIIQMGAQYMCYHGDPGFRMNTRLRPDYFINEPLVSHSPSPVSTQMSTFELNLDIYNLGEAIDTVFYIEINREYPNGQTDFVSRQQINAPYYNQRVTVEVPVGGQQALGINFFEIKIDADEEVSESPNPAAEQNNIVIRYPVQIISDAIIPVYPPEFAIVPEQAITLKASTGNTFANIQNYRIQIDTTEYFNSPLFRETTLSQAGGLVEWTPSVSYTDSVVYYWRVSIDSIDPVVGFDWTGSSFIFIDGSYPGWNQSHYFQYKKDEFRNIELNEPGRKFEFLSSLQEITLTNGFTPTPLHPELLSTYLNGVLMDRCRCFQNRGIYVTVIDSANLNIWENPYGSNLFGSVNCDPGGRTAFSFLFETDIPAKRTAFENFLRDSIPDGYFVILYSLNDADADNWQSSLLNLLQNEGSAQIGTVAATQGGLPWAFYYQKNNPSFAYRAESVGINTSEVISLSALIPGTWNSGNLNSTIIGPALNWYSFHQRNHSADGILNDIVSFDIYGLDSTKTNKTLLMAGITGPDTLLNTISAATYPYLQLSWNTKDVVNESSAQLNYWRILGDLAPEAALRPELFNIVQFDTVQQGMQFNFQVMMQNISAVDMDSMLIKYQIVGQNPTYKRLAELTAGDTMRTPLLSLETTNLSGLQYLFVEINPDNDQREMHHFNNIALIPFFVQTDIINPLLDVTFDGVRIMNGDLVSGKPQIVVSLTDENLWLGLDELEDFKIILRHPNFQNGETELSPTSAVVRNLAFLPADATNLVVENKAQIVMDLDLQWDGEYTLFVSATDKSGNNSGTLDYSVDFEVINASMISNVLNYPNPFTTSTQFVFTLTGRELPEYMKIQIFTISGKVVKEIGLDELGPIHIGINRTQYAWDGTDQYGDRLANGVYLYRVIAKMRREDEAEMKLFTNNISSMFRNGFGKMYLMR